MYKDTNFPTISAKMTQGMLRRQIGPNTIEIVMDG
jgi:hypothetical protein